MLTKDPVQKKLFKFSAFLLLGSFVFSILSEFIYDLYFSSVYGNDISLFSPEWVLSRLIYFVIFSGFLVLGLFLCKRWALVTGMIINTVLLVLSFYSYSTFFFSRDRGYDAYEKLYWAFDYVVTPLVSLVTVGGMYLCLTLLLFRKRPSAGLQKTAWILTLVSPVYSVCFNYLLPAFLENLGMAVLPPLAILSLLIGFAARVFLVAGIVSLPQKPTDHKLGFSGLVALIASLAVGVVICLVSMGIYDRVYVYDGYPFTKVLWILVFLGTIYGVLTAPMYLRFRFYRPVPIFQPPLEAKPSYLPRQQSHRAPQPQYQPPHPQYQPQYQAPQPSYQPQPQYQPPQPSYQQPPYQQPAYRVYEQPTDDLGRQLQHLKTLQQQGLISQEDYDAKKKQLLGL